MAGINSIKKLFAAAVLTLGLGLSSQADAASYPTFTIDFDQSSIDVATDTCLANCGVTASFTQSGETSLNFTHNWQRADLADIIQWNITNASSLSLGIYDIVINLVFTSPDAQSSTTSGGGLFATFYGIVSAGILNWSTGSEVVSFDQGSSLLVDIEDGFTFGFGSSLTTGMSIFARDLVAMNAPSPAPIPAALPVMLLALGGMVVMGRRRARQSTVA